MGLISISIFLISAAALGLELVLVRTLSIGHWYHFSYLVISTALLGFGTGGTFVAIFPKYLTKHFLKVLWFSAFSLAFLVPVVFALCQKVPLDELQLIWDWHQLFYLFAYYLLFFMPFFCAGVFTALAFTVYSDKAHRLYFFNMSGSGIGVAAIVALMYGNSPEKLLLVISGLGFSSALVLAKKLSLRFVTATLIFGGIWIWLFSPAGPFELELEISENKSLVYYSSLPKSETLATRYSPLARLDFVKAPAIRHFPGLSMRYQGELPQQILVISDADGISPINHFEKLSDLNCYDYATSAIAYHLIKKPDTCIIGAGGGSDVGQALVLGAGNVTAVEINQQVMSVIEDKFQNFSSGLYERDDVEVVIGEGRNFLQETDRRFDIINISLLDSTSASAAGVYALNESHLYTIEAVTQALSKLTKRGILSITRGLKSPPRDNLKMFATITEAIKSLGITEPASHIVMIRSWSTATILAGKSAFTKSQLEMVRRFSSERAFDLVHLPNMKREEANIYHVLEGAVYYENCQRILSKEREQFFSDYAYNIRPASDDRPYFFNFFKWKSLGYMISEMPGRWLPFSEWGYLVLAATLVQAVLASLIFILLPLWITKSIKTVAGRKMPTLIYFSSIGFAYMFLEMGFIQKMTLLIGHPVLGVAVTLLGFLFFSGCGALSVKVISEKLGYRLIWAAVLMIIVIGLGEVALMKYSFEMLVGFSRTLRILLGLAIIAVPAFFMGIPFPTALKLLGAKSEPLVPWAWGINGFASVTGAVLGSLLAISIGFTALILLALLCYFLAAVTARWTCI
ncbi:MAG: hypothetical protein FVQ80_07915 [Planctomycetes bacterium]|nr:hypothetical protein [Planctomycetota bacterium]